MSGGFEEKEHGTLSGEGEEVETPVRPAKVKVGPAGRIVIPAAFREALGIGEGDTVILSLEEGEVRLMTVDGAIKHVQSVMRQYVPEGVSVVDELIADRRREAAEEEEEGSGG